MLLVIDAGNTDIVFGIHNGAKWMNIWRMPSKTAPSREAWQYRLVSELLEIGLNTSDIKDAVLSSVVPEHKAPLENMLAIILGKAPVVLGKGIYDLINIQIENKEEIGTDLVANAVAGYEQFKDNCIVVDFGTALTFTTIADTGKILGIAIAPGLKTAIRSLVKDTAQLPKVPLQVPDSVLGRDTVGAIQAGVVIGYTGMVNYLLHQIEKEIGKPCKIMATGGLSSVITTLEDRFDLIDKKLTLNGLVLIFNQIRGK